MSETIMPETIMIGDASEIVVGSGRPEALLPPRGDRSRVAILYQASVGHVVDDVSTALNDPHPGEGLEVALVELADRDESKTWKSVSRIYDMLAEFNLGRFDTVVGVGGGAATDVAGFVAATWLRGVESVMIPTTLLGAVDASIGGKTGINHGGKNLVGAFWLPARVIVDLDLLDQLPIHLRAEGAAEIVKAGFLGAPGIVQAYERHGIQAPLVDVVGPAIRLKAAIVSEDLTEGGRRAVLNLGHTVGHGIETVTGMPHGFAVSIGLVAAAAVSQARFGLDAKRVTDLLFSMGLPVAASGVRRDRVLDLITRDKKRTSAGIRMVLLRDIGDPVVALVSDEEIALALSAVGIG